jgi:undecaprenyl phosphate N,N'-diacetylbacillosamine 1-phosphate transferase
MKLYKHIFKPTFDFVAALIGLSLASPILLISATFLYVANNGKPFFFQTRPGNNEKLFRIIKFKTMTDAKDVNGNLLPDAERMTKIGNFVRKTSLDELPQLLNVLKGDMSLIGPRPLMVDYLPLYSKTQARRHEVKPGITGWAQVNGRNSISWDKKFDFDVWYVDHLSFLTDVRIILLTFKNFFKTNNIAAEGHVTMPPFIGGYSGAS